MTLDSLCSVFLHVAILGSAVVGVVAPLAAGQWPADDNRLSWEGRYAIGSAHEVRLGFPGVTLRLRVRGSGLSARIRASTPDVYFNVRVDGGEPRRIRLQSGDNTVPLFSGAADGVHVVELQRATESWQGVCEILSVDGANAELLEAPPLPARKLMFIGDSITCGEGVVPNAPGLTAAERTDAAQAFGMKLAGRFHAQCHLVSYGGRGVIRDWQGIRATNNAPQFYELALPDDGGSRWNPAAYVPDAIGICLGTNDFNQGVPDENEFVNAYVEFVRKIQRDAPTAVVFLINSPILGGGAGEVPKRAVCDAYLDEVVRKVDSPLVRRATIGHYKGSEGDGHPVAAEHTAMADELEPVFRKALGW